MGRAPQRAGLGVVPAGHSVGAPAAEALAAVLLYRTATVWARVPPGWIALARLRRRSLL